ncbi:glycosyl hydrolase [Crateriforma spongiae]|uniref:glycosyl hydrolase n=1 Tax=Crateriforma spongiae TaxID=2724528 RepID=UPI001444FCD1|nr:glycosyl hydrolase [Crateriforma spongiae]
MIGTVCLRHLLLPALLVIWVQTAAAIEPVNPNLNDKARAVLNYLETIYRDRVLVGMNGDRETEKAIQISGKRPAVVNYDLCGWNSPTWGKSYTKVMDAKIEPILQRAKQGTIITMTFHWKNPAKKDGTAWVNPPKGTGPFDMKAGTTPGTPEYKAVMEDLRRHGDYLQVFEDAGVPILFRPLHEIDGGWFWWTDAETPENTAELYRMIFDSYVKERKLDNLIWVYNAGVKCAGADPADPVEAIEHRKRYYPGDQYVDISGIDIYPSEHYGWKLPQESSYAKAFEIMSKVTPGKMLAFSEGAGIPDPDAMAQAGPKWLYCLPWWADHRLNPKDWVDKTFNHPLMITLDELPDWDAR